MSNVRKGFLIALLSSNGMMLINFVASLFIARLLTPEEIGIFSVAYVFAGLLRTIREMGLGSYLVQETELTKPRIQTAFGISLLIAAICGTALFSLAGFAGRFYNEPRVTDVLYIASVGFFFVPLGATTMSLLRRDMRFADIARIDLAATLVQNTTAVSLALLGHGFMSLAWGSLAGILASVLGVIFYRPNHLPWRPSLSEWRRVLGFSSYVSGSALIGFANYSASDLVLGKLLGMEAVAFFNRAHGLNSILSAIIYRAVNAVSLPHFADINRKGTSMIDSWKHATAILNSVFIPFHVVLALSAPVLVPFMFGSQWDTSIPLVQILCIAGAIDSPSGIATQILTAAGRVKLLFQLDIGSLALRVVLILLAAPYGLTAIAQVYIVASTIITAAKFISLRRIINYSILDFAYTYKWCLIPAVVPATVTFIILSLAKPPVITIPLIALTSITTWTLASLIGKNPLKDELINILKKIPRKHI